MNKNNQSKKKNDMIIHDFSNPEAQKLFEEFTILLANVTEYVEKREEHLQGFNVFSSKLFRVRYLTAKAVQKLIKNCSNLASNMISKIRNIINEIKNKLKQILF